MVTKITDSSVTARNWGKPQPGQKNLTQVILERGLIYVSFSDSILTLINHIYLNRHKIFCNSSYTHNDLLDDVALFYSEPTLSIHMSNIIT